MSVTRVVLLRHGRTGHNYARLWQGQLDIPLDDVGRAQAVAAGRGLARRIGEWQAAGEDVRLVSSDLSRAYDTARAVGAAAELDVEVDKRLREIDAGAWQGLSRAQIEASPMGAQMAAWRRGEDVAVGGAERRSEAGRRVADCLLELIGDMDGGTLVAVSHGGVMRGATLTLLGLPGGDWNVLGSVHNCHAVELEPGRRWRLLSFNVDPAGWAETGGPPDALRTPL